MRSHETKTVCKKKYNEDNLNKLMDKVDFTEQKELLQNNGKNNRKGSIPLVLNTTERFQTSQMSSEKIRTFYKSTLNSVICLLIKQYTPLNKPAIKRNINMQDFIGNHSMNVGKVGKKGKVARLVIQLEHLYVV